MAHALPTQELRTCTEGMLYCFSHWANDVTTGAFWIFILLAFAVAIFAATFRFGSTRAFGFASFVGMIGGMWLAILQLMSWPTASLFILIGVVGIATMKISET